MGIRFKNDPYNYKLAAAIAGSIITLLFASCLFMGRISPSYIETHPAQENAQHQELQQLCKSGGDNQETPANR